MHTITKRYTHSGNNISLEGHIKGESFLPHGDVSITNPKGQKVLLGQYVNGKPHGKWLRWYDSGTLAAEHHYALGVLTGISKQYWDNSVLARESRHSKGYYDYEVKTYNKKDELEQHLIYKKGKLVKAYLKVLDEYLEADAFSKTIKMSWPNIPEKVCFINRHNQVLCLTPPEIWEGLKDELNPKMVMQLLKQLSDLYKEAGLDEKKKALTACSGTFVATTVQVSTDRKREAPLSEQEAAEIASACRTAQLAALGANGLNVGDSRRTQDAVNQISETVANCTEDDNSMIAWGWSDVIQGVDAAANLLEKAWDIITGGGGEPPAESYWGPGVDDGTGVKRYAAADGSGATKVEDPHTGVTVITLPDTYTEGNEGGKIIITQLHFGDGSIKSVRTEVVDEDDNTIRLDVRDYSYPGDTAPTYTSYTNREDLSRAGERRRQQRGGTRPKGTPSAGQPDDEYSVSKCEQAAASWAFWKAYCEQKGNNWQTYNCQEILRVFTGCADPALVYPTPDGDGFVCPHETGMTDQEFRQMDCERKKGIMVSSGFGILTDPDLCVPKDQLESPNLWDCETPDIDCGDHSFVPSESQNTQYGFVNDHEISSYRMQATSQDHGEDTPGLDSYTAINKIGEENFDTVLTANDNKTHFVVFASKTCGPCHKVLSVFNDEAKNHAEATFNRVEVAQNPELSKRLDIKYTPTILVFKNGEAVGIRKVGAASRETLVEYVNRSFSLENTKLEK